MSRSELRSSALRPAPPASLTSGPLPSMPSPRPRPRPLHWLRLRSSAPYRIALPACLALLLTGCAPMLTLDRALPEVPVPATWSSGTREDATAAQPAPGPDEADTAALADWWQHFDDPVLTGLVRRALDVNTTVQSAQAALRQARAVRDVQAAGLLPSASTSGSAQRARTNSGSASNRFQAGLDASWELDVFGRNRGALDAAEAEVEAARTSLAGARVSLAAEVALAYIDLRNQQGRLVLARRNLAAQRETQQFAQWRVQAGLATSIELEQARAAVEQTAAQSFVLENGIAQAAHSLAVLCGEAPATMLTALTGGNVDAGSPDFTAAAAPAGPAHAVTRSASADPFSADATPPVPPVPQVSRELALNIPADTLRQRPDIHQAEARVDAARARVRQADAARYPGFRLGGSIGLSALTLSGLGSGAVASSLLAGVSLPLFDGGALQAQVRAQEAALEQARLAWQATVLAALREVEDALVALRTDRERLAHLEQAAEAAGNAALLAQDRYASGLVDFQVVLDTQRTLLNTQDSVASTLAGVSADHVRLYKALGGGWINEPEHR